MPYQMHYVPPPTNLSLKVYTQLPAGIFVHSRSFGSLREASGIVGENHLQFHFCPDCEGWIEGHANQFAVDTLSPHTLSGRRGHEFYCRRCGYQIDFQGIMS